MELSKLKWQNRGITRGSDNTTAATSAVFLKILIWPVREPPVYSVMEMVTGGQFIDMQEKSG